MGHDVPITLELTKEQQFEVGIAFRCDDASILFQTLVRMARLVDPFGSLAHVVRLSLSFRKYISDGNLPLQVSSDQLGLLENCCGSSASALGFACRGLNYDSCL